MEARRNGLCSELEATLGVQFPSLSAKEISVLVAFCRGLDATLLSENEEHALPASKVAHTWNSVREAPGVGKKVENFDIARQSLPLAEAKELERKHAMTMFGLCYLAGRFEKAIEYFNLAETHEPLGVHSGLQAAESMARVRDYVGAAEMLLRCEQQISRLSPRFQDRHQKMINAIRQIITAGTVTDDWEQEGPVGHSGDGQDRP
jgi:hypothetical protein